ncbi:UBP-type zinc finger domain-containing protein [Fulvivirgaceae bacterium PWU5]|uniref:UBP-type zinc finger domain-containing protein n=1 Tax=Dawidia cretensis TaxID=2782350 RepID=A0AAP2GU99_9BACT|nr:UBP-type zinc finger domain-containing protein [Dawidia cretensis]MBT1708570.1 UBP-type zinc finger domain-containing protein [Dawidia cretensis]
MAKEPDLCDHLRDWTDIKTPQKHECEECVKVGGQWLHLRTCQTCGATFCCDSSPGRHASKHAASAGHPVAISAEPGERWAWCYRDEIFREY